MVFAAECTQLFVLGKRVNNGESTYIIQAFYEDCDNTGRTYASIRHKVISLDNFVKWLFFVNKVFQFFSVWIRILKGLIGPFPELGTFETKIKDETILNRTLWTLVWWAIYDESPEDQRWKYFKTIVEISVEFYEIIDLNLNLK